MLDKELFWNRSKNTYKPQKRGREQYMRLLARTIADPDEIWELTTYRRGIDKKAVIRRRYFVRFEIEGEPLALIGVFEWGVDGWRGITTYQAESEVEAEIMLSKFRIGTRIYVRP